LMGILFLVMIYSASMNKFVLSESTRQFFFTIFMFVGGAIFTTGIFSNLGDKRKAIAYLMLPASNFEKLLVAWLYSFVIFQLVYFAGFYIIDFLVLSMGKDAAVKHEVIYFVPGFKYSVVFLSFCWVHSVAFFGAVFFKKMHFIKTAFTVFVLILVIMLFNKVSINFLMGPSVEMAEPFGSLMIDEGDKSYYMKGVDMLVPLPYMTGGIAILLCLGAYFKLKETEV